MPNKETIEQAVFGGGCFWCTEAIFKMLRGVVSITPGYAGGNKDKPSYEDVSSGRTGHAEVVRIEYDSNQVSFRDLLTVFFGSHDPTAVNRQGNDVGPQYRSAVFYTTDEQRLTTVQMIQEINTSNEMGKPIATEVELLHKFFPAEDYHMDYYQRNKENTYCELVINPKLEKVQAKFAKLLREIKK